MTSIEVVILFTSLHIDFAYGVIKRMMPNYSVAPSLDICVVVDLKRFCLTSNGFVFDFAFYNEINDTATDIPLYARRAEIFMQFIKQKVIMRLGSEICLLIKYVNDVSLVYRIDGLTNFQKKGQLCLPGNLIQNSE